jgi:type I restriction enzyme R subunit
LKQKQKTSDDGRLFPAHYNVRRLNSSFIPTDTEVCISTIQRMYSILRGEDSDESVEETSMNEQRITGGRRDVVCNPKYPPEFTDDYTLGELIDLIKEKSAAIATAPGNPEELIGEVYE